MKTNFAALVAVVACMLTLAEAVIPFGQRTLHLESLREKKYGKIKPQAIPKSIPAPQVSTLKKGKKEPSAGCETCTASLKPKSAAAKRYEVGNQIPTLPFKTKTSWAGNMPIRRSKKHGGEARSLYFWLWSKEEKARSGDVVVWLNGGPGCSSLEGMTQENGPWNYMNVNQPAVPNPYSWTQAANILYVEQPVGTGFTKGPVVITDQNDVARDFADFLDGFYETFPELKGNRLFITGESYAGMYIPYIMSHQYDIGNKHNLKGGIVIDGVITSELLLEDVVAYKYAKDNQALLKLTDGEIDALGDLAEDCGYKTFVEDNLKYPPTGPLPSYNQDGCSVFNTYFQDALNHNPLFNIYAIDIDNDDATNPLGAANSENQRLHHTFFDNFDLQTYIHAPHKKWNVCNTAFPTLTGDMSPPPDSNGVLRNAIEKSSNFFIMQGDKDGLILTDGVSLALQNLTWSGHQGFPVAPTAPIYDVDGEQAGTYTRARGLTYAIIPKAGHMIPGSTPAAGLAAIKSLLGQEDWTKSP